jgi:hypothetical protein
MEALYPSETSINLYQTSWSYQKLGLFRGTAVGTSDVKTDINSTNFINECEAHGSVVVEALCYKPIGIGFETL